MTTTCVSYQTFSLRAEVSQDLLDWFSQPLHHGRYSIADDQPNLFFQYLKGCCHGNQFCGKITCHLRLLLWHSKKEYIIATSMCALTVQMTPLNRVKIWWTLVQYLQRKWSSFVNFLYDIAKSGSTMAEGPRNTLVSRNSATTKYPYRMALCAWSYV